MKCEHCGENDQSRLMTRTSLLGCRAETIDVCLECWWLKEIHGDAEDGKSLSKQKPITGTGKV